MLYFNLVAKKNRKEILKNLSTTWQGGFGTVYRAIDTLLGREVALKVLHPQLMVDESFVERFKKESRTLATLEHPNIVTIYELGEADVSTPRISTF